MKFGKLFELHKIPDWYTEYAQYGELKARITLFNASVASGELERLKGYYMINKLGQLYCIDFIKDLKPGGRQEENWLLKNPTIDEVEGDEFDDNDDEEDNNQLTLKE